MAAAYGGAYASHIRDESDYTIGVVAAVDEVIRVSREAGVPGVVTHIKALGPHVWGYGAALVHRIERAREQGIEVYADQYPYEVIHPPECHAGASLGAGGRPGFTAPPVSSRPR